MNTYAIVTNGFVENIVVWDGVSQFPLSEHQVIKKAANARIGEPWDDSMVELPIDEVIDVPAPDQQPTTSGTQEL